MIGYTTLGTNDLARGASFYDALLASLGAARLWSDDRMILWGTGPVGMLALVEPADGQPATAGNGVTVAIDARSPVGVAALHERALALGATDEGAPGPRAGFFAAYFRDLDGHKLCCYCLPSRD